MYCTGTRCTGTGMAIVALLYEGTVGLQTNVLRNLRLCAVHVRCTYRQYPFNLHLPESRRIHKFADDCLAMMQRGLRNEEKNISLTAGVTADIYAPVEV